jgi:hypothetical protein
MWLHGAISQKILNFKLDAVRTWNLTILLICSKFSTINLSCVGWKRHDVLNWKLNMAHLTAAVFSQALRCCFQWRITIQASRFSPPWININTMKLVYLRIHSIPKTSWGSSVSIMSDYRLDDQGSIPGKGVFLQLLCPDQLWGPPSLLFNGHWGSFLGGGGDARPRRDADHSPHLVPRSMMSRSDIPSSP